MNDRKMTAREVADEKFSGKVSALWVRRHFRAIQHRYSRTTLLYYEREVDAEMERQAPAGGDGARPSDRLPD